MNISGSPPCPTVRASTLTSAGVAGNVVNERPERTLHLVVEGDQERVAGHGIGAAVQEELHHLAVPSEQHMLQTEQSSLCEHPNGC